MSRKNGIRSWVSLVVWVSLAVRLSAEEPREVFRRFLDRITHDSPVSGEFLIRGQWDKEAHNRYLAAAKAAAVNQGGLIPAADRVEGRYRWAWDGQREMLESRSDNVHNFKSFFLSPDSLLDGMVPGNYNLGRPRKPYPVRPASFYFHAGGYEWTDVDERDTIELETGVPDDLPAETISLLIRFAVRSVEQPQQVRLFVRRDDYRPLGRDVYINDKLFSRVRVSDFQSHQDGRAFPQKGIMEIFDPTTDNDVMQTIQMRTVRIDFPSTKQELQSAFAMPLPEGTEIYDLLLNRKLILRSIVDAQEVMQPDSVGWVPME